MSNPTWADSVNSLINAYKRAIPLTITRTNVGTYDTDQLTTTGDSMDTTILVDGAIIPQLVKNYVFIESATSDQINYSVQAYTKAQDTSGADFMPQIGDIVTADQDYRVMKVNVIQIDSVYQGFILDLGI